MANAKWFSLILISGFSPLSAQQIVSKPQVTTPPIHLDVVVTPKSGPPVANLQRGDFTVLDNGVAQPVTSFEVAGGNQPPVEIILVVDAVNTSYQSIAFERGEIDKFLRADGGHLAHPTALAIFTDSGTQIQQGFSTDGNALGDSLDHFAIGLREIRRSAGFYGAGDRFQLSIRAVEQMAEREGARPGRKVILWVSPGWPLLSGPGIQMSAKVQRELFANIVEMSTKLRQAGVTLYSMNSLGVSEGLGRAFYYQNFVKGVQNPADSQFGNLGVQVLATQTGGLVLNSTGVSELLHKCVQDLDAYYQLSFAALPAENPNEYHHIEVKIAKPGLIARTRTGYYAQP